MSAFPADAGQKVGLEFWRIEDMHPATFPFEGSLFSGDAFIILHTYEKKGSRNWDLFFWLGKDCSIDERGAAAYQTVALDDQLGGAPVQHREVQGHESAKFLSLFPDGLRYQDGGIDSGFNKVDPDAYDPRLFHLKGKRNVRVQQVPLEASSMNHGDVFLLDCGLTLFQWNGSSANRYEKFKGLEMLTKINNDERGAKASVVVLEDGKEDAEEESKLFWSTLGGSAADIKSAEDGGSDDDIQSHVNKLLRVSDASGSMEFELVAEGKLERDMLDTNDVFLVDDGTQIHVWVGKGSNKDERKEAMKFATEYLAKENKPDWTPITRVNETGETPAFKTHFGVWDPPVFKAFGAAAADPSKKTVDPGIDAAALHTPQREAEEKMLHSGSGKIEAFRVENLELARVPDNMVGQFYSGDSYVIKFEYEKRGRPAWILYFWQGATTSQDEAAASALLTKKMDDDLGGEATQVRVVQNKEPNHFLQLFAGKMVVHEGGIASGFKNRKDSDSYDTDGISLFHVRGTTELNTRAVQVAEKATSLNSGDVFVLLTPGTMYVWEGEGANDQEKAVGKNVAEILKFDRETVVVPEGEEPDAFWEALGGKEDYPRSTLLSSGDHEPRLFHVTTAKKGFVTVEEVFDFSQDDLLQDDVFLLDCKDDGVFVWVGHGANRDEKDRGIEIALDYNAAATDGRSKDTPVLKVLAGCEPPNFTANFLGWNEAKATDFEDPYLKKLNLLNKDKKVAGPKEAVAVTRDDVGFAKGTHSMEDITSGKVDNIDPTAKESYLADDEFQKVFGMTKDAFYAQPKWKQTAAKKKHGLF